jgi:hypothetical protein
MIYESVIHIADSTGDVSRNFPFFCMHEPNQEVEQYTIKAVTSKEEAIQLGELGYEPFDAVDGVKLYRKRLIGVV